MTMQVLQHHAHVQTSYRVDGVWKHLTVGEGKR